MTPPTMTGWNLALRFGLEFTALAGLSMAARKLTSGSVRWVAVITVPIAVAIVWGVFNVLDDPSRSGAAPVEVSGWVRLVIEFLILGGGTAGIAIAGQRNVAVTYAVLVAIQYATSWNRVKWLVER